jgi:hypothetical protein
MTSCCLWHTKTIAETTTAAAINNNNNKNNNKFKILSQHSSEINVKNHKKLPVSQ